jgi:hypothetical protein
MQCHCPDEDHDTFAPQIINGDDPITASSASTKGDQLWI